MNFFKSSAHPGALFSLKLTFEITGLTIMINTFFGILTALHIARRNIKGWQVLNAITDLPFAVSPVIAGLALILVYSQYADRRVVGESWCETDVRHARYGYRNRVCYLSFNYARISNCPAGDWYR